MEVVKYLYLYIYILNKQKKEEIRKHCIQFITAIERGITPRTMLEINKENEIKLYIKLN